MDADSTLPSYLPYLLTQFHYNTELLYAEEPAFSRNLFRLVGSYIFNAGVRIMLRKNVRPKVGDNSGSSFRVIDRYLAQRCFLSLTSPVLLDVCLMNTTTGKIVFEPIKAAKSSNNSSYSTYKLIKLGLSLILAWLPAVTSKRTIKPEDYLYETF